MEFGYARVDVRFYENKREIDKKFWSEYKRDIIICKICERTCHLPNYYSGICGNYVNVNKKLLDIGYGILSAIESRPIEIKPLYHFYPNSTALTFSGWGCNFHCDWCQNYHLSMSRPAGGGGIILPDELVKIAVKKRDDGLCASFNEPTIHLQYLLDCFRLSKKEGLYNVIVSNGYMTIDSAQSLIEAGLDGLNIDIKGCPDAHKKYVRGIKPEIIFRNAKYFIDNNIHVEMVLLVVPGFNDDLKCLEWIIKRHVDKLGEEIPLHINRYYPAYKYRVPATPIDKLVETYNLAKSFGIKYVYIGNVWDPTYETTYCPKCKYPLIVRDSYRVLDSRLDNNNRCRRCGEKIYLKGKVCMT